VGGGVIPKILETGRSLKFKTWFFVFIQKAGRAALACCIVAIPCKANQTGRRLCSRLPQAFNTAFGLRASGRNKSAAQGFPYMAELGFIQGFPGQWFLNRPVLRFFGVGEL
jgi:hypothetical protein